MSRDKIGKRGRSRAAISRFGCEQRINNQEYTTLARSRSELALLSDVRIQAAGFFPIDAPRPPVTISLKGLRSVARVACRRDPEQGTTLEGRAQYVRSAWTPQSEARSRATKSSVGWDVSSPRAFQMPRRLKCRSDLDLRPHPTNERPGNAETAAAEPSRHCWWWGRRRLNDQCREKVGALGNTIGKSARIARGRP